LPFAVTGISGLATSVALILTITGELVIGTPGLGNEIAVAQTGGAYPRCTRLSSSPDCWGSVQSDHRMTERRVLRWHPAQRNLVPA